MLEKEPDLVAPKKLLQGLLGGTQQIFHGAGSNNWLQVPVELIPQLSLIVTNLIRFGSCLRENG